MGGLKIAMQRRRSVLVVLLILLIPAFVITGALVRSYRDTRLHLAVDWAARGDGDLAAHQPRAAVDEYRTALWYASEEGDYRLRLARALVASGRPDEAQAHLLTFWSAEPGNGTVNLELGRLEMDRGNVVDAVRYYHAAIDGSWPANAAQERRAARFELARALITAGRRVEAQPELIALGDDVGSDARQLTEVGDLLAQAGADARALATLRRALSVAPEDTRAAALAGDAAFRLGDLASARQYLERAGPSLAPALRDELDLAARVLGLDPFARGITLRARARRTLEIFDVARSRLAACRERAPVEQSGTLDTLQSIVDDVVPRLGRRAAERDDDLVDQALDASFQIEDLPTGACGDRSLDDRAIALLARERHAR